MASGTFLDDIQMIYVINLPSRTDRRAEMADQLARLGTGFAAPNVTLFPAVRPEAAGPFPSLGARGCFLSHLGVLRDARDRGFARILILEDDADFTQALIAAADGLRCLLRSDAWDLVYLGYVAKGPLGVAYDGDASYVAVPSTTHLETSHAIALQKQPIEHFVPYLEQMLARPPGDPNGGPMHVDGAYSWFRAQNPQIRTLVHTRQCIVQRASRSDIAVTGWKERTPLIGALRRLRNRLRWGGTS